MVGAFLVNGAVCLGVSHTKTKENPSSANRSLTYDFPIASSDTRPASTELQETSAPCSPLN